ncbi:hypothetical protein BDP27DRAFT_258621 [Rhodocollybia butyracea]|uniref:Uncharacterized protein n=1 Tax=Rhodocollybia butyracea TaxID=206335 RepID=A0A9P5PFQ8_9AGAR|nr:hypothetical protein BDP27DRAFT_258621 [Rhodocollybia butyracea]
MKRPPRLHQILSISSYTSSPPTLPVFSLVPPASGQATDLNPPLSAEPALNSNAPLSQHRGKASLKLSKKRVSEVSLAKDIVKSQRTGDLDEVFENDDGDGREDEDFWDLVRRIISLCVAWYGDLDGLYYLDLESKIECLACLVLD